MEVDRLNDLDLIKESTKNVDQLNPGSLKSSGEWNNWVEKWNNYMPQLRGAADIPLVYVYRKRKYPQEGLKPDDFASMDDYLSEVTLLSGQHYRLDNQRVWNELKSLVSDGPGWSFIKAFEKKTDGRRAVLALIRQHDGENSRLMRKKKAYETLKSLVYKGPRTLWTFDNYVEAHQKAHNDLEECGEPVPEGKKVSDFLDGIDDAVLQYGKTVILGDPERYENFLIAHQFLSTLVASSRVQEKSQRVVGSMSRKNGNTRGKKTSRTRNYSRKDWFKMSKEKRDEIKRSRKLSRSSNGDRKRSVGSSENGSNSPGNGETKPKKAKGESQNAGNEFGRSAHSS